MTPVFPSDTAGYPALERWRAAYDRGVPYPWDHPVSCAARHEANALELDLLAESAHTPLGTVTWRNAADEEMEKAALAFRLPLRPEGTTS